VLTAAGISHANYTSGDHVNELAQLMENPAAAASPAEQLALYDFTIFHGFPQPFMISDAPFIDWRVRAKPALPLVSLPLGPYALLAGTPSSRTSRSAPLQWKEAPAMGPFRDHNRHQVDSARRWLVATTDDQLIVVQPRFAPPEAAQPDGSGAPAPRPGKA